MGKPKILQILPAPTNSACLIRWREEPGEEMKPEKKYQFLPVLALALTDDDDEPMQAVLPGQYGEMELESKIRKECDSSADLWLFYGSVLDSVCDWYELHEPEEVELIKQVYQRFIEKV